MNIIQAMKQFYSDRINPSFSFTHQFGNFFQEMPFLYVFDQSFLMKDLYVPSKRMDNFNAFKLLQCKEAYRPIVPLDLEGGNGSRLFGTLVQSHASYMSLGSIEGYHTDKHLSYRINLKAIETLFCVIKKEAPKIRHAIQENPLLEGLRSPIVNQSYFYSDTYRCHPDVTFTEQLFMQRITGRIAMHFEQEIIQEMPFPQFQNEMHITTIQNGMSRKYPLAIVSLWKPNFEDQKLYSTYQQKLYEERDKRVFKWFDQALTLDKKIRDLDSTALLTHLTTIPSLEQELFDRKARLIKKMIQISLISGGAFLTFYWGMKNKKLLGKILAKGTFAFNQLSTSNQLLVSQMILIFSLRIKPVATLFLYLFSLVPTGYIALKEKLDSQKSSGIQATSLRS
ncbi:MAG: hypothetical protein QRY71_00415 [Candidatus Rhabdochlamydia sp.]